MSTLLVVAFGATSGPVVVQAASATGNPTVKVEGRLASVVASPLTLTPAFDPSITDYVLGCAAGTNSIQFTLSASPGARINLDGKNGPSIVMRQSLLENQALVLNWRGLKRPGGRQYWIRCLPHDFPHLTVTKSGSPPPGWYLTGNINASAGGGTYAMVLDNNGTPVWYRSPALAGVLNLTLLSKDTLAWMPFLGPFGSDPAGAFEVYNLATRATRWLAAPLPPTDEHELLTMPNGHRMMLSTPLRPNIDMSALGGPRSATIVDCLLQEVDGADHPVWTWRASDHLSPSESVLPSPGWVRQQLAYDLFHCNSIDIDPTSRQVLLSVRNTNAVYLIDRTSSSVIWKLGSSLPNHDRSALIKIVGDPEVAFGAQHDARFEPNGDISLYDDQSFNRAAAARGVEYHVDVQAGVARIVWSYAAPDGRNAAFTGSFRRLDGGTDNVIGWGGMPNTLFTEVDAAGHVMLDVRLPQADAAYRVVKVASISLDHDLLRSTAGLPRATVVHEPRVTFVAPFNGPPQGGASVILRGTGFSGATAVNFGSVPASVFKVVDDGSILALTPPGIGVVNVVVRGPGGRSPTDAQNLLLSSASDSSFESGTGTWIGNSNSSLALSSLNSKTGSFSLQVSANAIGGIYAQTTGAYAVAPGANVEGGVWVLAPEGTSTIQLAINFYDEQGSQLASVVSNTRSVPNIWTHAFEQVEVPIGAATAEIGLGGGFGLDGPLYIDDAFLGSAAHYNFAS